MDYGQVGATPNEDFEVRIVLAYTRRQPEFAPPPLLMVEKVAKFISDDPKKHDKPKLVYEWYNNRGIPDPYNASEGEKLQKVADDFETSVRKVHVATAAERIRKEAKKASKKTAADTPAHNSNDSLGARTPSPKKSTKAVSSASGTPKSKKLINTPQLKTSTSTRRTPSPKKKSAPNTPGTVLGKRAREADTPSKSAERRGEKPSVTGYQGSANRAPSRSVSS